MNLYGGQAGGDFVIEAHAPSRVFYPDEDLPKTPTPTVTINGLTFEWRDTFLSTVFFGNGPINGDDPSEIRQAAADAGCDEVE